MPGVLPGVRTVLGILVLAILLSQAAFTHLPEGQGPHAFFLVASDNGTALYQRESRNGYLDFVQVVHLNQGAAVKLLHSPIVDPGYGEGVYGGDNPLFVNQPLADVWADFTPQNPHTFCLTNGQFYSAHASTVRLSFPLKVDGQLVSDGFGIEQFPEQKLMLELWPNRANIVPLSEAALQASVAPNILVGLSDEAAGRRPNMSTGRTFVGVGGPDQAGYYQTILIFTSRMAAKTEATIALRSFGAEKVMMLDGGASTQLICQGENYVGPGRHVPQAIAVLSAPALVETYLFYQAGLFLSCALEGVPVNPLNQAQQDWPFYRLC
jgi:hypothetical protein